MMEVISGITEALLTFFMYLLVCIVIPLAIGVLLVVCGILDVTKENKKRDKSSKSGS